MSNDLAPILQLPNEILINILSYILVKPSGQVTLRSKGQRRWRNESYNLYSSLGPAFKQSRPALWPNHEKVSGLSRDKSNLLDILLVSRHFYFAGITSFFRENVFHFESMQHLHGLARQLNVDRKHCIAKIAIQHEWYATSKPSRRWHLKKPSEIGAQLGNIFGELPKLQSATLVWKREQDSLDGVPTPFKSNRDQVIEEFEEIKSACHAKQDTLHLVCWNELATNLYSAVDMKTGYSPPGTFFRL